MVSRLGVKLGVEGRPQSEIRINGFANLNIYVIDLSYLKPLLYKVPPFQDVPEQRPGWNWFHEGLQEIKP